MQILTVSLLSTELLQLPKITAFCIPIDEIYPCIYNSGQQVVQIMPTSAAANTYMYSAQYQTGCCFKSRTIRPWGFLLAELLNLWLTQIKWDS